MTSIATTRPDFDLADTATLKLDLGNPKPKEIYALVETFEQAIKARPDLGPLPLATGWHDITPDQGVQLLLRNRPGANRKVDPGTVFYYANQMAKGKWMATGQPMLFDLHGHLQDAQHRLYAGIISGMTFRTFVVTGIEPIPGLFAYIDNARPRNAATALQTSGRNGVSPTIVKVLKISEEVRLGIYNPSGATTLPRMSPAEYLELAERNPNAQKAARSAASDWEAAVTLVGERKDIVAYLGMQIINLHGEDVADDFFDDLVDVRELGPSDPVAAMHKLAAQDARSERPMKRHHMLAALIKVFNAWVTEQPLPRRWMLQVNENFPALVGPDTQTEEAA